MATPNIVFIMTDQQRWDTIAALGAAHMVTPHMDRMVRNGLAFGRAYCPGATCVASRAAIFTGAYAHNSGAYTFGDWAHHRTWVKDLSEGGYYCASIGKMHFQPRDEKGGFHERVIVENPTSVTYWGGQGDDDWGQWLTRHGAQRPNHRHRSDPKWKERFQGVPWELEEHLHSDVFIGDSAVNWLDHYRPKHDMPFFLQIGFTGPHEPWDPTARHLSLYDQAEVPGPVNFPCDLNTKPQEHLAHRHFHSEVDHESVIAMPDATLEDILQMRRLYYAKISLVDEQIGKVLSCLERNNLLNAAIVILTSDHGEIRWPIEGDHALHGNNARFRENEIF